MLLSRVANNLYWMSRYVERAENTARFINVTMELSLDNDVTGGDQWEPLVQTTGDQELFSDFYEEFDAYSVQRFLTVDSRYPNSIASCIAAARENARTVREVISREMWEVLNGLHLQIKNLRDSEESIPLSFYDDVRHACTLFQGITSASMSRGKTWHFMQLGRMIERSDKTSRILDVKYYLLVPNYHDGLNTYDHVQWTALLKSTSALQMYRSQYRTITPRQVAGFLVLDPLFPRSLRYCGRELQHTLHALLENLWNQQKPISSALWAVTLLISTMRK